VRFEVRTTTGRSLRAHRAALGDRDLEVGEEFEQERLEFLVGAVDFVDQQHGGVRRAQRRQHRPLDQEIVAIDVDGSSPAWRIASIWRG
jgi:hypothetical protein